MPLPKSFGIARGWASGTADDRPVLAALSIGPVTLDSTMNAGAVVASISGQTPGSLIEIFGDAIDSRQLDIIGADIVIGDAGPLAADTVIPAFDLFETLAGAIGTPRFNGGFGPFSVAPPPFSLPVFTQLPVVAGDTLQGGRLIVTPGEATGAETYRYRFLAGTVDAPSNNVITGPVILLDWTTDTTMPVGGIEDGDFVWVQQEATGPGGVAVVTSAAGHGPMAALIAADAVVTAVADFNSPSGAVAFNYTLLLDIPNIPSRGLIVQFYAQATEGAFNPQATTVRANGTDMTLLYRQKDGTGTGARWREVWVLWGNAVPITVGATQVSIVVSKAASSNLARSHILAIAVANTQPTAPVGIGTDTTRQFVAGGTLTPAFANVLTAAPKRLLIGFFGGPVSGGTTSLSVAMPGWTVNRQPWASGKSVSSGAWGSIVSRAVPAAASVAIAPVMTTNGGTPLDYSMAVIDIAGDNS